MASKMTEHLCGWLFEMEATQIQIKFSNEKNENKFKEDDNSGPQLHLSQEATFNEEKLYNEQLISANKSNYF